MLSQFIIGLQSISLDKAYEGNRLHRLVINKLIKEIIALFIEGSIMFTGVKQAWYRPRLVRKLMSGIKKILSSDKSRSTLYAQCGKNNICKTRLNKQGIN